MNEFIEKLIGRLEEEKEGAKKRNAFDSELSYKRAIEIINQLAEEYKQKSAWQSIYDKVVSLEYEYAESGEEDVANDCIRLENLLQYFKEELQSVAEYNIGWIPCSRLLPPHSDDLLLIQCSGKPKNNITFENAFQLASYTEEGWILELFPEWKDAEVVAWMNLPEVFKS